MRPSFHLRSDDTRVPSPRSQGRGRGVPYPNECQAESEVRTIRRSALLGFQLVEPSGKLRFHGDFHTLYARFPLSYKFKVPTPMELRKSIRRDLDVGTAMNTLLKDRPGLGPVASRSAAWQDLRVCQVTVGHLWRVRGRFGRRIELGVDCHIPGQATGRNTSDKGKVKASNSFGDVTVTGPDKRGNVWSLLIKIKPKD